MNKQQLLKQKLKYKSGAKLISNEIIDTYKMREETIRYHDNKIRTLRESMESMGYCSWCGKHSTECGCSDVACACFGACKEKGYCPVLGRPFWASLS